MSMGYIPKKKKQVRRERRMRKKYKNFSCLTCIYAEKCRRRVSPTPTGVIISKGIIEFCPDWKASREAKKEGKVKACPNQPKKKKCIIKRMF